MFTGDKITAKEAEELNMIYKCISEEEFEGFHIKNCRENGTECLQGPLV